MSGENNQAIRLRRAQPEDRPALVALMGALHDFEAALEKNRAGVGLKHVEADMAITSGFLPSVSDAKRKTSPETGGASKARNPLKEITSWS